MLSVHTSQIFLITNLQSIVRFFNAHQPLYKTRRLNALNEHRFSATNYKVPTIPPNERNIKRKKKQPPSVKIKKINLRKKTDSISSRSNRSLITFSLVQGKAKTAVSFSSLTNHFRQTSIVGQPLKMFWAPPQCLGKLNDYYYHPH